jgi:hypothetical protein
MMETETEAPLNKKDITAEIIGAPFFDLNVDDNEIVTDPQVQVQPQPEDVENPLVDIIDVGLDFAEDFLKDAGYPEPKRKIWEEHGRKAMSKALNAYCPPGSALGGVIDTPLVALLIGFGALLLCFYPVIAYYLKSKNEKEDTAGSGEPEKIEQPKYEKPSTGISSTAPISRDDKRPIDRLMANNVHAVELPGF